MPSTPDIPSSSAASELSDREQEILRLVVKSFIGDAGPIGSRSLAKRHPSLDLSAATIRNTMRDLEEMGYLDHPHISAGRMPTERGYRAFVDELMDQPELSPVERQLLRLQFKQLMGDTEELLRESSHLLGRLTNLLGLVLTPRLSTGVLERLDAVPLSSERMMFVVSVQGGLVNTIVAECDARVERADLDRVLSLLNERLTGLTLAEIRRTSDERVRDLADENTGIVRVILDEAPVLFSEPAEGRLRHGRTQDLLAQPEFQEPDDFRDLVEMLEDEHFLVHLLEEKQEEEGAADGDHTEQVIVRIGSEHRAEKAERLSVVASHYRLGEAVGTVGVLGPTRMDYARVMALVRNTAVLLSS